MPTSAYPLPGLIHRIDTYTIVESDDGFGGIVPTPQLNLSALHCRVTKLTAEAETKEFGLATGKKWKIIVDGSPKIPIGHLIQLSKVSNEAPITTEFKYLVIHDKLQQDDVGGSHHLTIFVEKEDENN